MSQIRRLAERIGERFRPKKVVLFGSYAVGNPTPDSDVDVLVVMTTDKKPFWQSVEVLQAVDCHFPIDLIVRTPEDYQQRLEWGDPFVRDIDENGVTLYESGR